MGNFGGIRGVSGDTSLEAGTTCKVGGTGGVSDSHVNEEGDGAIRKEDGKVRNDLVTVADSETDLI